MSTPSVADYKDTPREELTAKISKLLKLNYEVVNVNPLNTTFNCDEVAQMVYDRIATSGDFSYTNIMKIIEEFVYNKSEIYDQYQPDEYRCKPRDYQRMLETLNKVGNPRVTAFADWYANASIYEQNSEYESKYAEYFVSLDDLVTLHEIELGIIHVDGLNLDDN